MEENQLFSLPEPKKKVHSAEVEIAEKLPVARVLLDVTTTHLDRLYDFAIPVKYDEQTQMGVRVQVRFKNRTVDAFVIERVETSDFDLSSLLKVYSPLRLFNETTWQLCEAVATRYATTRRTVLRHMIPPRNATAEKEVLAMPKRPEQVVEPLSIDKQSEALAYLDEFREKLEDIISQKPQKLSLQLVKSYGAHSWYKALAFIVSKVHVANLGSIVVLPDFTDVELLATEVSELIGKKQFVTQTHSQSNSSRYRGFALTSTGKVRTVIGTRSAVFAPVEDLSLIIVWDDSDENHQEISAPYQHTRDIALMRSEQEKCSLIFAGFAVSTEVQRLVELSYLQPTTYLARDLQALTPMIRSMADDSVLAYDPQALMKRLPDLAFRTLRQGLELGPVLIQVPHAGFFPALSCQNCHHQAMCTQCHGPIYSTQDTLLCRLCLHVQDPWKCSECNSMQLRSRIVGSDRTAYELAKSFPGYRIISSAGDHIVREIEAEPALVVATPGAEPQVASGYQAAVLLDADAQLYRSFMKAEEKAFAQWLRVASLVKPAGDNGRVLLVSQDEQVSKELIEWAPYKFAHRVLLDRYQLSLPPAVRVAILEGKLQEVKIYLEAFEDELLEVIGPYPIKKFDNPEALVDTGDYRAVLKFSYTNGPEVTKKLRSLRTIAAINKKTKVIVKVDASYEL
ncbi:MAG: hypothetical protein QM613_06670 [Micrococcaceae bacterium]